MARFKQNPWFWIAFALYLVTILTPSLDRFLTWDEAVFYSQSGGLDGAETRQRNLVASRELGSSPLIAILRFASHGLSDLRLLWASLTYALLLLGARKLVRHIGDRGALTFLVIYGSYWLVIAYAPAFYANGLFAVFALLTTTLYLDLLDATPSSRSYLTAVALGLAFTAAFAMRPLEAGLLGASLFLHFGALNLHRAANTISRLGLASIVALITTGIPWITDSYERFGSVSERLRAAMAQPGQAQSGLRFNLDEYLGMWVGDYVADTAFGPMPSWPRWLIYAGLVAASLFILRALSKSKVEDWRGSAGAFLFAASLQAAFFLFWRAPIADRYFFGAMIFAAALLGWATRTINLRISSPLAKRAVLLGVSIWLLVQVGLVTSYDTIRTQSSAAVARAAATMRTLSAGQSCRAISRYGAPQLEVASGCRTGSYTDWEEVMTWVDDHEALPSFVYGPYRDQTFDSLPDDWTVVPVPVGERRQFALAFRMPPGPGSP